MAATRRKQDDRNLESLRELIAAGDNRYCLDCGTRGPTYVNTTIGSFVCSKCSGMLRGLTPPHRVKSISMAAFTPEEMELIRSRGNEYCRRIWLGLYEGESAAAKDEQSIRDFMSEKYEKKSYYLEPDSAGTGEAVRKSKQRSSTVAGTPLVSIAPQATSKQNNNVGHTTHRPSNAVPSAHPGNVMPRPINNFVQTAGSNVPARAAPVPEFAVDFSTANIYNSSQYNNNNNNNNSISRPEANTSFKNSAVQPPAIDRYAALAALDTAVRQQKCFNPMDENGPVNRNSSEASSADQFANKNPFSNGGSAWAPSPSTKHFNPFVSSTTSTGFTNTNNPFL